MEKECLRLLLRGRQPVVVCPARSIENIYRAGADFALSISQVTGQMLSGRILGEHRITGTYSEYENTTLLENGDFAFTSGLDFALTEWGGVQHAGHGQVVEVVPLAAEEASVLLAQHPAEAHRVACGAGGERGGGSGGGHA